MVSPILELKNINKSFGHVHANKNINLTINKGTIHGIIGENGAGKSTLMSIVFGLYQANSGTIKVNGKEINLRSPKDSIINGMRELGIEVRPIFFPLHEMPPYKNLKKSEDLSITKWVADNGISLPSSVDLTDLEQEYVCDSLLKLLIDQEELLHGDALV